MWWMTWVTGYRSLQNKNDGSTCWKRDFWGIGCDFTLYISPIHIISIMWMFDTWTITVSEMLSSSSLPKTLKNVVYYRSLYLSNSLYTSWFIHVWISIHLLIHSPVYPFIYSIYLYIYIYVYICFIFIDVWVHSYIYDYVFIDALVYFIVIYLCKLIDTCYSPHLDTLWMRQREKHQYWVRSLRQTLKNMVRSIHHHQARTRVNQREEDEEKIKILLR